MAKLAELVKENFGKNSYLMTQFFQEMVKSGQLKAYSVELNKRFVEKDTKDEEIVRTKKGATLTPTDEVNENQNIFIEDSESKIMYHLNMGSRGGMIYDDGDSQTIYHHCVLEKLSQKLDLKQVSTSAFDHRLSIPEAMITARLRVNYSQDWGSSGESDYVTGTKGNLVVEGEQDKLFEKVCKFVREK